MKRVVLVIVIVVACSSVDQPERANLPQAPRQHRAQRPSCAERRASPEPSITSAITSLQCTKNADCASGRNGRCVVTGTATKCVYDTCVSSVDCPGVAVCECGDVNICVADGCLADGDCGQGGYCSASSCTANDGAPHYCHTRQDECLDDADCPGLGVCRYQSSSKTWRCEPSTCH